MSKNIISLEEARGLAHKLITESIPIREAFLVSRDGTRGLFHNGFLRSFSDWLLLAGAAGDTGWHFRVPLTPECIFRFGDKREIDDPAKAEEFARAGEAALMVIFSEGSNLTLFFNL